MRIINIFNFVKHIRSQSQASGKKRVFYSILNIVLMALGVATAVGIKLVFVGAFSEGTINFIAGILFLIVLIPLALLLFLQGFVGQFALVVIAGIGISDIEQRGSNVTAFIVSLITSIGLVVTLIILINLF